MLLLKANNRLMLFEALVVRFASKSILRAVLLTTALCSLGNAGVSVGSADEKFHSSSSAALGAGACAGGEDKLDDARAANGSEDGAAGGG